MKISNTQIYKLLFIVSTSLIYFILFENILDKWINGIANFTTTIALYVGLLLVSTFIVLVLNQSLFKFYIVFVILIVFFIFEFSLRYIVKQPLTYSEKNGGTYFSSTRTLNKGLQQLLDESRRKDVHTLEFAPKEWRNVADAEDKIKPRERYNRLGMRGQIPGRRERLIITLGDSFTEGVCVTYENSYPKVLEELIKNKDSSFGVLNAGTSGNDPFFDFKMLQKLNNQFNIHTAIFLLNTTDINDVIIRGGNERFLDNGMLKYQTGPLWEYLFASSCIFRVIALHIFKVDYNLQTFRQANRAKKQANNKICLLFENDIVPFCNLNNINLIVALHPMEWDLELGKDDYMMLSENLSAIPEIKFIDTYQYILNAWGNDPHLYYEIDGHFNENGYYTIANTIYLKFMHPFQTANNSFKNKNH
jgi:hypothetical protein